MSLRFRLACYGARAVIWEVFRGRKAPVANRDAKSSKFGGGCIQFPDTYLPKMGPIIRSELPLEG